MSTRPTEPAPPPSRAYAQATQGHLAAVDHLVLQGDYDAAYRSAAHACVASTELPLWPVRATVLDVALAVRSMTEYGSADEKWAAYRVAADRAQRELAAL